MVLKNIFLDNEGLHKSKPVACKVTGTLTINIDGKSVRVKQCNNAIPKSKNYLSIHQKEQKRRLRKHPSSPKKLRSLKK